VRPQTPPPGVPRLQDLFTAWTPAEEIEHLPSLRNQIGQAHVNADLTSVSWLAAPPYSFGYHTGVLRVDGGVVPALDHRWRPWGVQRRGRAGELQVRTDVQLGLSAHRLTWEVRIRNEGSQRRTVSVEQDLFAPVTHTDTGWGWLYDVPWSSGNEHDYFALERVRDAVLTAGTGSLLGVGARRLRLGRPRPIGIQRDEDDAPMLIDSELPAHHAPDTPIQWHPAARAGIRDLVCTGPDGSELLRRDGEVWLEAETELSAGLFALADGQVLSFGLLLRTPADGTVLTHGNHPDSLAIAVEQGRPVLRICGEQEKAAEALALGVWHRVDVLLAAGQVELRIGGQAVASVQPWTGSRRWSCRPDRDTVVITDSRSAAVAGYAFTVPPTATICAGPGATASWSLDLAPGEVVSIGLACVFGDRVDEVLIAVREVAADLATIVQADEDGWSRIWADAFTPGNGTFSGHLPALITDDAELSRAYYLSALVPIYLRQDSGADPVFLTGGPRLGPTTTFCWDHAEWSRLYAMLDPAGLRAWLQRILSGPYNESFGIDVRSGGALGNEYAATDYALFRLLEHYVSITEDTAFLAEKAGDRTILQHLEGLALSWIRRQSAATGGVLADFGDDAWRLLECVPNYTNAVASFNAAYVEMTRAWAGLLRHLGQPDEADQVDELAAGLCAATLDLYAGEGRWLIRRPDGDQRIGHVLDFGLVAAALHEDLAPTQIAAMVGFVQEHLIDGDWIHALAPDDPVAPFSDRPDHGSAGAFCAWPGVTAYGLCKLGRPDLAAGILRRTPAATSGALWGQAMEYLPHEPGEPRRVGVAERGVANRDSVGAAAIAEAVLAGLFGVEAGFRTLDQPRPWAGEVGVEGIGRMTGLPGAAPVRCGVRILGS